MEMEVETWETRESNDEAATCCLDKLEVRTALYVYKCYTRP